MWNKTSWVTVLFLFLTGCAGGKQAGPLSAPGGPVPKPIAPSSESKRELDPLCKYPYNQFTTSNVPGASSLPWSPYASLPSGSTATARLQLSSRQVNPAPVDALGKTAQTSSYEGLQSLHEVEQAHILCVLEACGGSQAEAARVLGIARNTLWRKLRALTDPG